MRPAPPTRHLDLGHFTISPDTAVTQSLVAVSVASLYSLTPSLPGQDCGECPTAYTALVVPGTIQAEDFDLGGEVREMSMRLTLGSVLGNDLYVVVLG